MQNYVATLMQEIKSLTEKNNMVQQQNACAEFILAETNAPKKRRTTHITQTHY